MQIVYSDDFKQTTIEIGDYLEEYFPKHIESTFVEIERVINLILENPFIGKVGIIENTRELFLAKLPYFIVYRIKEDELHILNIIHTSRKYP
ncbi:MAG: type II toxin-antitoxin system RelE/ParE family toxin [Alphaproteobacteria bacterium]|jgi:toxin ParE1/3/4|nr:type II toxin-antitoxin system RelE/ParE family toxin [Alphaproteobacteria bacterium]